MSPAPTTPEHTSQNSVGSQTKVLKKRKMDEQKSKTTSTVTTFTEYQEDTEFEDPNDDDDDDEDVMFIISPSSRTASSLSLPAARNTSKSRVCDAMSLANRCAAPPLPHYPPQHTGHILKVSPQSMPLDGTRLQSIRRLAYAAPTPHRFLNHYPSLNTPKLPSPLSQVTNIADIDTDDEEGDEALEYGLESLCEDTDEEEDESDSLQGSGESFDFEQYLVDHFETRLGVGLGDDDAENNSTVSEKTTGNKQPEQSDDEEEEGEDYEEYDDEDEDNEPQKKQWGINDIKFMKPPSSSKAQHGSNSKKRVRFADEQ